jgi:hypothetical protein
MRFPDPEPPEEEDEYPEPEPTPEPGEIEMDDLEQLHTIAAEFEESYLDGEDPEIASDAQGEDHLRCYRYWLEQHDVVQARFDREVGRIMARAEKTLQRIERRREWHLAGLKRFYEHKGEPRLVMANATISTAKGRQRIEVQALEELVRWAAENDQAGLLRTTTTADKTAIQRYIKSTGEEPAGVSIERAPDSLKVKF